MNRPSSVTIASWIWMFCALFTTFTIANVLTATEVMVLFTGMEGTQDGVAAGEVIGVTGWLIAVALLVVMAVQVVAAVKLRDGTPWARIMLSIAAFFTLLAVVFDVTLWSAWLLLAANIVAVVLAYSQTASVYLEARPLSLVSA